MVPILAGRSRRCAPGGAGRPSPTPGEKRGMSMSDATVSRVDLRLEEGMRFQAKNGTEAVTVLDAAPPGGGGAGLTPMEMLLAGLGACTAMDVLHILRKKRLHVTDYRLEVTGQRQGGHPNVFTGMNVRH